MKILATVLIVLSAIFTMGTGLPASQEAAAAARGVWDIRIDKTSIERILLDPESILEDPEAFWRSDPAYRLAESWHRNTGVSKSTNGYDKRWPAALKKLAALPREERKNRPEFRFLESLMGKTAAFEAEALPFIRSFLPANEIAFRTSVYLTTQTFPYAFMANGDMVVDILSLKFRLNADQIFNILTHETFHVGYGYNRYLREEPALDDGFIYSTLLDSLQNEGMATYMAYRAQSLFPAPFESDYRLLDNPQEVKRRFEWINRIFEGAESGHTGREELGKEAWELGVNKRGYYVAGAHMARVIDEKLGREALVRTVVEGPLSFVDRYNEVSENGFAVHRFGRPGALSPLARLLQDAKTAVLAQDEKRFDALVRELGRPGNLSDPRVADGLVRFGYGQLYLQRWDWAIKVFSAGVGLFPKSANAWDCLAEANLKAGRLDQAEVSCRKALQLDPKFESSRMMLEEIKKLRKE